MAHVLDNLIKDSESLILKIKKKYKTDKTLCRQLLVGARERADYSSPKERWSMEWYIQYLRELENVLN